MTELGKEYFGPLWKYVADEKITDVDYNGREIWLTNTENMRYRANPEYIKEFITDNFIEQFTQRIANVVSRQFNKQNPQLEAETSELRVTIVHESVARSGRTISIRKTPPIIRLTEEKAVQENFCEEKILALLINCVKNRCNMIFAECRESARQSVSNFFRSIFRRMTV